MHDADNVRDELLAYLESNAEWYGDDEESPGPDCRRFADYLRGSVER